MAPMGRAVYVRHLQCKLAMRISKPLPVDRYGAATCTAGQYTQTQPLQLRVCGVCPCAPCCVPCLWEEHPRESHV